MTNLQYITCNLSVTTLCRYWQLRNKNDSRLRVTRTHWDRKKSSSYTEIRLSRCSHKKVILSGGKSVPRTTLCDNSRYTEPSYAEFIVHRAEHGEIYCIRSRIRRSLLYTEPSYAEFTVYGAELRGVYCIRSRVTRSLP